MNSNRSVMLVSSDSRMFFSAEASQLNRAGVRASSVVCGPPLILNPSVGTMESALR